jgi:uncharacterized protein GlcG (DUF336 family)
VIRWKSCLGDEKLIVSRFPIYHKGKLIGGVGVSGGTVPQDVEVALAGLAGIGASSTAPM